MQAYYRGMPVFGQRGPAGPDGTPIGTIISFMGLTAPTDYLICDGSLYNISDYPDLAAFFREQFGSETYFGDDGEGTFAVPDMRNLFLRGYRGEADEQLSGDVGKKQEGTVFPYFWADENIVGTLWIKPSNMDSTAPVLNQGYGAGSRTFSGGIPNSYTSRPVNMAVLYCIKATKEKPYEDIYSEEETVIGRWIDGRPVYRRVIETRSPTQIGTWSVITEPIKNIDAVILLYAMLKIDAEGIRYRMIPDSLNLIGASDNNDIRMHIGNPIFANVETMIIINYTKTTDPVPSMRSVEREITSRVSTPKSGTVTHEGEQYDYTLPDSTFAHASASSVGSFASFSSFASSIASSVKDIFKEN